MIGSIKGTAMRIVRLDEGGEPIPGTEQLLDGHVLKFDTSPLLPCAEPLPATRALRQLSFDVTLTGRIASDGWRVITDYLLAGNHMLATIPGTAAHGQAVGDEAEPADEFVAVTDREARFFHQAVTARGLGWNGVDVFAWPGRQVAA